MFFTVIYKNDMIKYLVLIGWGVAIRLFVWGGGGEGLGGGATRHRERSCDR